MRRRTRATTTPSLVDGECDEDVVAPPAPASSTIQPGTPTTFTTGNINHEASYCETSQNTSHASFSLSFDSSSSPPSDIPSIIVVHALCPSTRSTNKTPTMTSITPAFALVSPSPSHPASDDEPTIATTTYALMGLSGSKRSLLYDTMSAPQQHELKLRKECSVPRHPKLDEDQEGEGARKMESRGPSSSDFEELLACGDIPGRPGHHRQYHPHPTSLLEVAVGYGYHLACCRMMNMINNKDSSSKNCAATAELSGILDPRRRLHEIVEHGAQTVVRMKEQERLLFWKYMQQSETSSSSPTIL
jgi:hypothetical protein